MNRLIIVGSPRVNGRSAALADLLFEACIEACPHDELALAPVATLDIEPCRGCDSCKALMDRANEAGDGEAAGDDDDAAVRRCVIEDDMREVYELVEAADEVIVVSPVYFAGAPAQLKALLDRLQPYFWSDARVRAKRPATLHVVGEGGDPHGFEPLVGVVRSALSCSGFALERVLDWVGRIDEDGEITAEAVEHPLVPLPGAHEPDALEASDGAPQPASRGAAAAAASATPAERERPVLHVAKEEKPAPSGSKGGSKQQAKGSKPKGPHGKGPQSAQGSNRPAQGPSNKGRSGSGQNRSNQGGSKQSRPKQGGKQNAKRAHEKRSSGKHGG